MRLTHVITAALFVVACEKGSSPTSAAGPQDSVPAQATAPLAASDAAVGAKPDTSPSEPTTNVVPSAGVAATTDAGSGATLSAADGGKKSDAGGASALKPASKRVGGNNFSLDLASPGCTAGSECAMTIKLVATADYHVNKEYPYKFIATPSASVAFLGKPEPNNFTRASGDFIEEGEKTGTMTVRFKPSIAGDTIIAGTYKFSVCSADQCQIEQEKLELKVAVQ